MGQKIVLSDVVFTDTTLPVVLNDPILSNGSLFLFDPSHSLGAFDGVPSNGGTVPNIAWAEAAAILGSGTQSSLMGTVASTNATEASKSLVERTTKLGVHQIISLTAQTVANNWIVSMPTAIRDYMYTHRSDHSFYVSIWFRVTRPGIVNASMQSPLHYAVNPGTSNYLYHAQGGTPVITGSNKRYAPAFADSSVSAGQEKFLNMNPSGITGTGPTNSTDVRFGLGNFDSWQSSNLNKTSSRVIYRVYIEDLTVSGRSYAAVDALDYAMFQAAFASGGKFYGDTYTDPSTIP